MPPAFLFWGVKFKSATSFTTIIQCHLCLLVYSLLLKQCDTGFVRPDWSCTYIKANFCSRESRDRGINSSSELHIPQQESFRNVQLVNYVKFCPGSEALPIKPIRDEGLFACCQEIKRTPALFLPAFRPFPSNPVFRVWLMDGLHSSSLGLNPHHPPKPNPWLG